eukprot:5833056-Amphidinium_carterae.1
MTGNKFRGPVFAGKTNHNSPSRDGHPVCAAIHCVGDPVKLLRCLRKNIFCFFGTKGELYRPESFGGVSLSRNASLVDEAVRQPMAHRKGYRRPLAWLHLAELGLSPWEIKDTGNLKVATKIITIT